MLVLLKGEGLPTFLHLSDKPELHQMMTGLFLQGLDSPVMYKEYYNYSPILNS